MDQQLRQRLVGATIIVLLVVIFVPMFFENQSDDSAASDSSMQLALPQPMEEQTIELPRSAADAARQPKDEPRETGYRVIPLDDPPPPKPAETRVTEAVPGPAPEAAAALEQGEIDPASEEEFPPDPEQEGGAEKPAEPVPAVTRPTLPARPAVKSEAPAQTAKVQADPTEAAKREVAKREAERVQAKPAQPKPPVPPPAKKPPVPVPADTAAAKPPAAKPAASAEAPKPAPQRPILFQEAARVTEAAPSRPAALAEATAPKPAAAKPPAAKPAASAEAPKPAPKRPAETAAKPAEPGKARESAVDPPAAWVVQTGTFTAESNARSLVEKLRRANFPAFVETVAGDAGTLYRVQVGPELNRGRAEQVQKQIEATVGIKGYLLAHP